MRERIHAAVVAVATVVAAASTVPGSPTPPPSPSAAESLVSVTAEWPDLYARAARAADLHEDVRTELDALDRTMRAIAADLDPDEPLSESLARRVLDSLEPHRVNLQRFLVELKQRDRPDSLVPEDALPDGLTLEDLDEEVEAASWLARAPDTADAWRILVELHQGGDTEQARAIVLAQELEAARRERRLSAHAARGEAELAAARAAADARFARAIERVREADPRPSTPTPPSTSPTPTATVPVDDTLTAYLVEVRDLVANARATAERSLRPS